MSKNDYSIGIFDSGIGGLTVLSEVRKMMPHENIIYLGDTANLPYGIKSQETIKRLTIQNILFLLKRKVKLIVVACNTASSVGLKEIRDFFSIPIFGVVEAGVKAVLDSKQNKRVGVIGTAATINSNAYQKLLKKDLPKVRIYSRHCPLFVPLVEEGMVKTEVTYKVAQGYLSFMKGKIDSLILGCTHYPLLIPTIKKVLPQVRLINSAHEVAKMVKTKLKEEEMSNCRSNRGKAEFYLTDKSPCFEDLTRMILKTSFKPQIIKDV